MPESQPTSLVMPTQEDWQEALQDFLKQTNYIVKDLYNYIDGIYGYGGRTFEPENISTTTVSDHTHTTANEGGDYAWADFIAADVTWVQALRGTISASNILSRAANEEITGTWRFPNTGLTIEDTGGDHVLTIKPGSDLTASKTLTITTGSVDTTMTLNSAHIVDASTAHAITDPADSPASADALRDNLVANTIPSIETALNNLGTKINSILARLETAGISLSS